MFLWYLGALGTPYLNYFNSYVLQHFYKCHSFILLPIKLPIVLPIVFYDVRHMIVHRCKLRTWGENVQRIHMHTTKHIQCMQNINRNAYDTSVSVHNKYTTHDDVFLECGFYNWIVDPGSRILDPGAMAADRLGGWGVCQLTRRRQVGGH